MMNFRRTFLAAHLVSILSAISFLNLGIGTADAIADVRIAPLALYLGDEARTGRIIVENMSDDPKDIEIALRFGYPASDSSGNVSVRMLDSVGTDEPSATGW